MFFADFIHRDTKYKNEINIEICTNKVKEIEKY